MIPDDLLQKLGIRLNAFRSGSADSSMSIPLTTAFTSAKKSEYLASPRAVSVSRKLLNSLLFRLKQTGLFNEGNWIDIGGSRVYGDWLGVAKERYDVFNLPQVSDAT